MTKEQKFYNILQDVFIGAKIEGQGGFINLMRIKAGYYSQIEKLLKEDINKAVENTFRDELFDKLYTFFNRYFTESGSIYFNSTPFHNNIYEKVYTDEKDVILFWKTQMLYYVKTDRIFRSMPIEFDELKFYFDASRIENKKANEKRSLIFELDNVREDRTIVFAVAYSERGTKTKQDEILKVLKQKRIAIIEEQLEKAFRVFEKQSELDFFINKNAKAFLQEQFKLWSYQYFWEGAKGWGAERVNQLQILKSIAFKIIDFISQFENELVKIWNKPKFVKNSNYVITLDRIADKKLIEKILQDKGIDDQIKEWQEIGIVDENFKIAGVLDNSPLLKGWQAKPDGVFNLPYNPKLKEMARELRKAGNLSEVLLWNNLKQKRMLGFDFTRQQIIGDYIVDFHCPKLNLVIEIDGESHNYKGEYDEKRDNYLQSLGLSVLHFADIDIKKSLNEVLIQIESWIKINTPSASQPPLLSKGELNKKYEHLPIDTRYFKGLELEILSLFDDLDNQLNGWLIKSENYQALNTILPKFKEKVQTIYIDPPFNLDSSDQFLYRTNYKDANWATLLENRLKIAKDVLNEKGSIFVRCDYNGNWIVRCLMDSIYSNNFINELDISRIKKSDSRANKYNSAIDTLFWYSRNENYYFEIQGIANQKEERWHAMDSQGQGKPLRILGELREPPVGRHWTFGQENIIQMEKEGKIRINGGGKIQYLIEATDFQLLDSNWTDIPGYTSTTDFQTENSEKLLTRVINTGSKENDLILDFFLGSGTTTAVAHKLGRKWLGIEMGEHFYTVVLPRMKKVLAYDKGGISKEAKEYKGGGFFKYYELEQYEEALASCKYQGGDLLERPSVSQYQDYVFMKDEKMLSVLEIDYKNNKVKVDLTRLYPNIDIAETLSSLTGKWIKKVSEAEVEFEDGTKINIKDLDYKLIKSLIWWE